MRKLKDSGIEWIGKIPENWKVQRAKTLFSQRLTKGNQDITLLAATQKYGMLPQSEVEGVVQVKENADLQQFRTVHKDDYVISLRSFQGGFEFSQYEGVCSPAYQVFYNIKPVYHPYYRLMFKSDGFIKKMNSLTVGIRDGKNIQYDDFANSLIPVPPLDEQEHIASYLDRKCSQIDAIIAKQQQIIEKLKEYKLSVITEAVTKGLDPNVPMKDSGVEWIGKIPEHWVTGKIKNFCNLKTGSTPSTSNTEWFDGMIRWFTPGDFVETFILKDSARTLSQKAKDDMVAVIVPPNTVMIVGIGATAGKIGYTMVECSCNQQITAINTNKIMPKYLMYWMIANTKFLRDTAMFTTLPILNNQTIGNYLVMFPDDRNEEKEVVDYLDGKCDKIEILIEAKKHEIDRLHRYKKSIIYEIVTGKMEV